MSDYLTIKEAADLLRVKPETISERMRLGVFKLGLHYFKRAGHRALFKREALIAWVECKDLLAEDEDEKKVFHIPMSRGYNLGG